MRMFTCSLHYLKWWEQSGSIRSNMLYHALFLCEDIILHLLHSGSSTYCSLIFLIETEIGHVEGKISAERWFYISGFPSSSIVLHCFFSLNFLSLESGMLIKLLQPSGGGARGGQKSKILIFIRSICLRSSPRSWKVQSADRRWNSRLLQRRLIKLLPSRYPSTMHFVYSITL